MKADEFMAIAPLFASENDAPRPAFSTPFRHGDHLFASDGRIALVCSDTGSVNETEDEMQKHIGNRLINEHIKTCEDNIACGSTAASTSASSAKLCAPRSPTSSRT